MHPVVIHVSKLSCVFTQGCVSWSYLCVEVKLRVYTRLYILAGPGPWFKLLWVFKLSKFELKKVILHLYTFTSSSP